MVDLPDDLSHHHPALQTMAAATIRKTIVVVGATGIQGGSVARTFLSLPTWRVRAITRNPSSPAAQALASSGAEVVQADLSDPGSLSRAFQDANAIFLNTDFWKTYRGKLQEGQRDPGEVAWQTEVSHGKNAVQAAASVPTLERLVYSALPSMKKQSDDKYHGLHSDSKATIVEYVEKDLPELAKKTSFIYLGAYNTNAMLSPRRDPSDGKYKFLTPVKQSVRLPIIDPNESTGTFVRALVEDEQPRTKLLAYDTDSYLTLQEVGDVWSRASGKEASFVEVTVEFLHEKFHLPMEVIGGIPALNDLGYTGGVKMIEPADLKTKVQTKSYEEWMKARDWKAILEVGQ